jgi:lipopolysaccharide exporter
MLMLNFIDKNSRILQAFKKNEYVKNFSLLLSGNVFSQLLPIVTSPIIARLYNIESFGELAIILGVSSLISIGATLQYESAIVLPDSESESAGLLVISLIFIFATTALSFLILPFRYEIAQLFKSETLASKLHFVPAFVFIQSLFRTFNFWAVRHKMYKTITYRQIGQTATQSTVKILFGLLGFAAVGLIWGTLIGLLTSTTILIFQSMKSDYKLIRSSIKFESLKSIIKKYSDFPKFTLPHGYSDIFIKDGIIFFISSFYGATVLGYYSFSKSLLKKPVGFIGSSLRQVFYKRAVELKNNPLKLWNFTKQNILYLSISSILVFSPILFFGDDIFRFVYGDKWATAGVYSQYMVFWMIYIFIMSPISSLIIVIKKQKVFFVISLLFNILTLLIIIASASLGFDFKHALGIISIFCILFFIFIIHVVKKYTLMQNINDD